MKKKGASFLEIIIHIWLFFFCAAGFGSAQGRLPQTKNDLFAFLDSLGDQYERISVEMGVANWNLYSGEGDSNQDIPKAKYAVLFLDPIKLKVINEWLGKIPAKKFPRLFRRLQVWKDVLTAARVEMDEAVYKRENRIEAAISGYCHQIQGKMIKHRELRKSLEAMFDSEEMEDQIYHKLMTSMQKKFEPQVIELMKIRNQKARAVGFDDYGQFCLEMMGLLKKNSLWFDDMIRLIDKKTLLPFKRLLNSGKLTLSKRTVDIVDLEQVILSNIEEVPEHPGANNGQALELAREILLNIGFDLKKMPIRIVENIIPYGGLGLAIRVPSDHRILIYPGRNSVSLFLHELGHGLHAVLTQCQKPIFKNYEWCLGASSPPYDEGMANVISGFSKCTFWQKKYFKKSDQTLKREQINLVILAPYSLRQDIAEFMFELEMYKNPDKSPQQVKKGLEKKWLLIKSTRPVDPYWATSIYPVAYPCYLQNYFISRMIAWQVHDYLERRFGPDYILNQRVGKWLQDNLFRMGHEMPWLERIKRATGKSLDVIGYLKNLGIK